jgi:hypothetical protein
MDSETPENPTESQRILIISEDPNLALSLQILLGGRGKTVRWEANLDHAHPTVGEFRPAVILTTSASTVFVGSRHSPEIFDLPRPIDTTRLLNLVESLLVTAALCDRWKVSKGD